MVPTFKHFIEEPEWLQETSLDVKKKYVGEHVNLYAKNNILVNIK